MSRPVAALLADAVDVSLEAVKGLQDHTDVLQMLFEAQCAPTPEIVRATWDYAETLKRANKEWASARAAVGGGGSADFDVQETDFKCSRIFEDARHAEDVLLGLAAAALSDRIPRAWA